MASQPSEFERLFKLHGMKGFDKGEEFAKEAASGKNFTLPDEPQDTLDLHGMIVKDALYEVGYFLQRAREAGHKKVLVITGKGLNSDGGVAKLRPFVARLFNEMKDHQRLKDFQFAENKHGGMGAYYVFI